MAKLAETVEDIIAEVASERAASAERAAAEAATAAAAQAAAAQPHAHAEPSPQTPAHA